MGADNIDWRGFGKYSPQQVIAGLTEWMHDSMEREAWNDADRSTYRYRAGLLQKAIADFAASEARAEAAESQAAELRARCDALRKMLGNSVSCVRDYATARRQTGHSSTAKFYDEMASAIDALLAEPSAQGVGNGL